MIGERRKAAEELVEQVASLLHEIWSEWFLHQYQNSTDENVRRWMEQCLTGYSDLSENDKDKDRKLAQPIAEMILAGQECGEARAAAEIAALREAVRLGKKVILKLEEYGASIVPHLMDNDDNDGERFRQAIRALETTTNKEPL